MEIRKLVDERIKVLVFCNENILGSLCPNYDTLPNINILFK